MKKIPLTQGKFAIVDDWDFQVLSKHKWHVNSRRYAARTGRHSNGKRHYIYMHKVIMWDPSGYEIDHINGNPLDNRKDNLRVCTHAENVKNCAVRKDNTSGYKGVCWFKTSRKWLARIKVDGKQRHLGYFDHKEDAVLAYNNASRLLHGKFAYLNKV